MRSNVIDLAVGVMIGGAFGKIVSSFVADVLMPPIGIILGGVNVRQLAIILKAGNETVEPVLLRYGLFLQTIIDFLIIAAAVFFVVKAMNAMQRKADVEEAKAPPEPTPPSREEQLLTEIRDAIREGR